MREKETYHTRILKNIHNEKKQILTPEYRYALGIIADKMYKEKYFIRELIQNSDDAGSKKILFEIDVENRIVRVTNWGKPFDKKDVRQICTMLPSEKEASQIGTLGVGFKSVFAISDKPKIYSGGFNFEIEDYILPTEIDPIDFEDSLQIQTVFLLPLPTDVEIQNIMDKFESLNNENILFLNNLKEIEVKFIDNDRIDFTVKKDIVTGKKFGSLRLEYTQITKNNTYSSKWLVFKRKYKIPNDLKKTMRTALKGEIKRIYKNSEKYFPQAEIDRMIERKILKFTNPSIAILSTEDWNPKKNSESKLFISLPSETMTGLKFHINAEFKPLADRSGIEKTEINDWIVSKIAKLRNRSSRRASI